MLLRTRAIGIFSVCLLLFSIGPVRQAISQAFTPTSPLNSTLYNLTATPLSNGMVLITGGGIDTSATSSAELYDPSSRQFTATGSMHAARANHTATLLANGKVLIVGGSSGSGAGALDSAELYDPSNGTFSSTGNPIYGRSLHSATLLADGTVLVAGGASINGSSLATAEIYDPASNAFHSTGNMTQSRVAAYAVSLADGTVLVGGGNVQGRLGGTPQATAEVYNPVTSSFSSVGSMNRARTQAQAVLLTDRTVLVLGGLGTQGLVDASTEIYNPGTHSFTTSGNMTATRYIPSVALLVNGSVLVAGGSTSANQNSQCQSSAEIYNPTSRSFSTTTSMSATRCLPATAMLTDGSILLAGGSSNIGSPPAGDSSAETYTYPSESGSLNPKYVVLAVAYAPPGSKSSVAYNSSTLLGTSTSLQNTFSNNVGVSTTIGTSIGFHVTKDIGGSVSVNGTASTSYTQEADTTSSISVNKTTTNGISIPGPASSADGLDHDYDIVFVWLNPVVNVTLGAQSGTVLWNGYSYDQRDPINDMDVVGIYVYCLKNPTSTYLGCSDNQYRLSRSWDTSGVGGLTQDDFNMILARDPFVANPSFNPENDTSGRFDLQSGQAINYEVAPPGGQPFTTTYQVNYQTTSTMGQNASDQYNVGFAIESKASGSFFNDISYDLKTSNTTTWTNKWSTNQTQTNGQTTSFSITGPASTDNYTGPTAFQLWKDNVYGTFMFYAP